MKVRQWLRTSLALVVSIGLGGLLLSAIWLRPQPSVSLPQKVREAIPDAGIEHPITAVLLNFRSYDTLLEVAVLLVAVVISLALTRQQENDLYKPAPAGKPDALLMALTRRLLPLLVLTGVYVLWAGSYQPGGAFQAGALIAAAGVLARLVGFNLANQASLLLRVGLALGFTLFLTVAMSAMFGGRPFLNYPDDQAGTLIFLIEAVLTFSIALTLLSLFIQTPRPDALGGEDE